MSSESAAGPVECISAVTLATADMATSVAFYEALGFDRLYGGPAAPFSTYRAGSGFVNLSSTRHRPTPEVWGRVIFWVDDVDAMYDRARRRLVPGTEPADAAWGERYFHVRDPDGHELSFARPLHPLTPPGGRSSATRSHGPTDAATLPPWSRRRGSTSVR